MDRDERFMRAALALARRGRGRVSPNPMVGAVVVRADAVISRGYHGRYGGPHAEVEALARLGEDLRDATLYVTLEPCCHEGKTPPCTALLLGRRVGRVVVGTLDPNPQVSGRGVAVLREAGVDVRVGVLEAPCRELNRVFFHWMSTGLPWVTLKWAQSLDGRIATASGHARWISSQRSRKEAHALRALHDAILVGVGTVGADDPRLTVRRVAGRSPVRLVLDSRLRISDRARVLGTGSSDPETWVVCTHEAEPERARRLESRGVKVLRVPADGRGEVDVRELLRELGPAGISSVLVEGGGRILTSFLRAGAAQRVVCFVAPLLLGKGIEAVQELHVQRVDMGIRLNRWRVRRLGDDLMVDAWMNSEGASPAGGAAQQAP